MKKKQIILIVIAAVLALSSITALPKGNVVGGVGCLVIAAVLVYLAFKPQKAVNNVDNQPQKAGGSRLQEKIRTKVVGVTYNNEDGTNRQDILAAMTGLEHLTIEKYSYNGEPAAYVKWDNKTLGNLSAELAKDLARKYPDADYTAELLELTGGNGNTIGCNIEISIISR